MKRKYILFHETFYVSNETKVNEIKLQKLKIKLKIRYIKIVVFLTYHLIFI